MKKITNFLFINELLKKSFKLDAFFCEIFLMDFLPYNYKTDKTTPDIYTFLKSDLFDLYVGIEQKF